MHPVVVYLSISSSPGSGHQPGWFVFLSLIFAPGVFPSAGRVHPFYGMTVCAVVVLCLAFLLNLLNRTIVNKGR